MSTIQSSSTTSISSDIKAINDIASFDPKSYLLTSDLDILKKPSRVDSVIYTLTCGCLCGIYNRQKLKGKCDLNQVSKNLTETIKRVLNEKNTGNTQHKESLVAQCKNAIKKFNELVLRVNEKRKEDCRYDVGIIISDEITQEQEPKHRRERSTSFCGYHLEDIQKNPFPQETHIEEVATSSDSEEESTSKASSTSDELQTKSSSQNKKEEDISILNDDDTPESLLQRESCEDLEEESEHREDTALSTQSTTSTKRRAKNKAPIQPFHMTLRSRSKKK